MDFWNDLSTIINRAANTASREFDHLSTTAKKRYQLSTLRAKLSETYEALGKLHYDEFRIADFDGTRDAIALCNTIDSLKEKISALEGELDGIRHTAEEKICAKCGTNLEKGMQFCPKCGEKLQGAQ